MTSNALIENMFSGFVPKADMPKGEGLVTPQGARHLR
jgi:hypothetical protein